jgi:hypothetical protein
MKKILAGIFFFVVSGVACGNEGWVPYVYRPPIVVQPAPIVQNFQLVQYYNVPIVPQYVPVTTYQDVLVEHKVWCFHKRYEIVRIPQTVYVPVKY